MRLAKLALRNLSRNRRRTGITASAIASGLSLVLLMVGLQTGSYADMLRVAVSSMAGHVVVQADGWQEDRDTEQLVPHASEITHELEAAFPGATVTPRLYLGGLITSPFGSAGVMLRGIVPSAEAAVDTLHDKVVEGAWLDDDDDRGIVLGAKLAESLQVGVGDKIVYMGQTEEQDEMVSRMFRVRGIVRTGGAELDSMVALVTLGAAQVLLERPDVAHQVALHLPDPERSPEAEEVVVALVGGPGIDVLEWPDALPDVVHFIHLDRTSGDVMMAVMGLIVAMGVLNTVLMSVLERTKEFGVLMAIGMPPRRLAWLVLLESFFLGVLGAIGGVVVGSLFVAYLVRYGLDYSAFMGGEALEMQGVVLSTQLHGGWNVERMGAYVVATLFVTVLAGVYPALYLSRLEPVEALRAP